LWNAYHGAFAAAEGEGLLRRPTVPDGVEPNAHMYYLLLRSNRARDHLIELLAERRINAVFHYVPLHSSPAGRRYGRTHGSLSVTDEMSGRLVRLPLWSGMTGTMIERVANAVNDVLTTSPSLFDAVA
jgi:dTDP-4-amino-4,6-dideoxygalactose transaminase